MEVAERQDVGLDGPGRPLQGPAGSIAPEPATVPGCHPGTEVVVIAEQQWRAIRERHAAGMSLSGISRELDLDRKTVRRALRMSSWAPYQRAAPAPMMLDAHREWLVERAPQVHYSARILYQQLTRERGFAGCYETVKLAVRPLRTEATKDFRPRGAGPDAASRPRLDRCPSVRLGSPDRKTATAVPVLRQTDVQTERCFITQ